MQLVKSILMKDDVKSCANNNPGIRQVGTSMDPVKKKKLEEK